MLSFHVKFVQTDRQTDTQTHRRTTVKQYAPDLSIRGHNNAQFSSTCILEKVLLIDYMVYNTVFQLFSSSITAVSAPIHAFLEFL